MAPEKKVIAPGESSAIKATLKTRGKKGKLTKSITVTTNDPANPTVRLTVIAKVII